MKIHTLKLKNIHSIREETTIDFSSGILGEAGLFAITGPTGAGKSTLLDAIVLALYNRIPRYPSHITKSVIEKEGVVLSKHAKDAFVELVFEVNGRRYRTSWSIARNRNGILNERMQEVSDAHTGAILAQGTSVPDYNTRTIGLGHEQFVQSMVLAQGQFDKLLRSNKNSRYALLEKLTGGRIYRSISQKIHQKHAQLTQENARLQAALEEVHTLTDAERSEKRAEQEFLAAAQQTATAQLEALNTQIQNKITLNNLRDRLRDNAVALDNHAKSMAKALGDREALARHEDALPLQGPFAAMEAAQRALEGHQASLAACLQQLETAHQKQRDAQSEARLLLRVSEHPADFQAALISFRQQFIEARQLEAQLLQASEEMQNNILERADRIRNVYSDFPHGDTAADQAVERLEALSGRLLAWGAATQEDLLRLREEHNEKQQVANRLMAAHAEAETHQANIVRLLGRDQELRRDLEHCTGDILRQEEQLLYLKGQHEEVSARHAARVLQQSLEGHRALLVEGEPCPLCGATHHPAAGGNPDEGLAQLELQVSQLAGQVEATRSRLDTLRERKIRLDSDKNATEDAQDKARQDNQNALQTALSCCRRLGWPVEGGTGDWQQRTEQLKVAHAELDRLIVAISIRPDLEGLVRQYPEHQRALQAWDAARQKRTALYAGSDLAEVVDRHLSALQQASSRLKHLLEQQATFEAQVQSAGEQFRACQATLEERLLHAGLTIATLRASLLPEDRLTALRAHLRSLDARQQQLKGEEKSLTDQIAEAEQEDRSDATLDDLQSQWESMRAAQSAMSERQGQLSEALRQDEEHLQRRNTMLAEHQRILDALQVWTPLDNLVGSASGDRFVNLVQEITLKKLLGFTNQRLRALNSRYQIISAANGDLFVIDTRLGDSERSIQTLSGGEMFTLSLAMALGLSDLASRNAVIESMFVDEGFGSLDPETLNDAISVLEHIQATGNKSIGIISHVSELNQRIGAKIRVEPNGNGSSTVSVTLD